MNRSLLARWWPALLSGLLGLSGAWSLWSAGGWLVGMRSIWAFSALSYLPTWQRGGLALIILAVTLYALLPWTAHPLGGWGKRITGLLERVHSQPAWRSLGLLVAALAFWSWRERTFHGDALLKLRLLNEQTLQTDPYVWKEPLDSLVAYTLSSWGALGQLSPETMIALASVLAGLIYLSATVYVAVTLADTPSRQWLYLLGLWGVGSSQLWFGHVENYSWVTAFSFAATALAVGYSEGRNSLWPVGLLAGLAVSFHPQAAFTLPALLLLIRREQWWRDTAILLAGGLVATLGTVLGLRLLGVPWPTFGQGFAGDDQLFLTPAQALAPHQVWDALNNLWLIAPLAPLWFLVGGWGLGQRALWQRRSWRYVTLFAAGLLCYHFTFQNDLPRPRDWDLFAIVGPGVTLWGLLTGEHWLQRMNSTSSAMRLAWPPLAFALCVTIAWVMVNHSVTLIQPTAAQRDLYSRYQLLDLTTLLDRASISPPEPLCAEPEGCERVTLTTFTMPQDGDSRPTIFAHAPARISLPLTLPAEATFLWLSPALDPEAWGWGGDGVTFRVAVVSASGEVVLWERHLTPAEPADLAWQTALISLADYRNQSIELVLITDPGPAGDNAADRAGWGLPWLLRGTVDERF
jgi:hypothetical protein